MDGNLAKAGPSGFYVFAIVRDKLGRIVVDESIFHDKDKLELLRQEVIKDGCNARNRNP